MVRILAAILLIVTSAYAHAGTLVTRINGIEEAGIMRLAIYATAVAFENDQGDKSGPADGIIDGVIEAVAADSATYRFELPAGTYAIGLLVMRMRMALWTGISSKYPRSNMASVITREAHLVRLPLRTPLSICRMI